MSGAPDRPSRFSDADLLAALETAAEMVDALGDVVMPLFERLQQEYSRRGLARAAPPRYSEGPRFLTDVELRLHFGLSERALTRLRLTGRFPGKDDLIGKTDRKLVDAFFDRRASLAGEYPPAWEQPDGKENFQ